MNTVDVVVLTKNSSITLDLVIKGIRSAIPVNKLFVVDGGSTDSTLKIARKYGAKIILEKGKLGKARFVGAREVETEWFCFIDSDILVFPFWYRKLARWTSEPGVVWVGGLPLEHSKILKSYAYFKSHGLNHPQFQKPVALSNSILRRDVVLGCKQLLRNNIHGGEDSILYEHVCSQGYRVIKDFSFFACLHLPDCFLHDIYALYRGGYSIRLRGGHVQVKYIGIPFYNLRSATLGFMDTLDPRLFGYYFGIQGMAHLIKHLGIAGKRVDSLVDRLEKSSEMMGVNMFLRNPRDPEGGLLNFDAPSNRNTIL